MNSARPARTSGTILHDPELDARLHEDGFVVLPLLDEAEIPAIQEAYERLRPADDTGLAIDYSREDRALVRRVTELLSSVWDRHLPDLFVDHHAILSTFVTKYPGPDSAMRMHREPTFIEPGAEEPYVIWVPLVDVGATSDKGVLEVIPGTQDLPAWLSGYDTPEIFKPYEGFLRRHARVMDVPAGAAVVLHSRMLHFSPPNESSTPRMAFGAVVARRDAPLVHVMATGRRGREVYAVDSAFITDSHPSTVRRYIEEHHTLLRVASDDAAIAPDQLARAIGVLEVPQGVPLVPDDLQANAIVSDLRILRSTLVQNAGVPQEDVKVSTSDLPAGEIPIDGVSVQSASAGAVVARLTEVLERGLLPDLASLVANDLARAAVVALEPGARITFAVSAGRWLELGAYECPVVNAGMRGPQVVGTFELGRAMTVRGPGPISLWNEGPGSLWVVMVPLGRARRLWRTATSMFHKSTGE